MNEKMFYSVLTQFCVLACQTAVYHVCIALFCGFIRLQPNISPSFKWWVNDFTISKFDWELKSIVVSIHQHYLEKPTPQAWPIQLWSNLLSFNISLKSLLLTNVWSNFDQICYPSHFLEKPTPQEWLIQFWPNLLSINISLKCLLLKNGRSNYDQICYGASLGGSKIEFCIKERCGLLPEWTGAWS